MRRALFLTEGPTNRREWIETHLQELAKIFSISTGGFSIIKAGSQT
jgi:hypothetical protein